MTFSYFESLEHIPQLLEELVTVEFTDNVFTYAYKVFQTFLLITYSAATLLYDALQLVCHTVGLKSNKKHLLTRYCF